MQRRWWTRVALVTPRRHPLRREDRALKLIRGTAMSLNIAASVSTAFMGFVGLCSSI
jgi:Na+-translocating ferredoxin:NAD+ oxidoreductase RnfA subunit